MHGLRAFGLAAILSALLAGATRSDEPPAELLPWLAGQRWERDTAGPILDLGPAGRFDDTHIFGPCVVREPDRFLLWYSGAGSTHPTKVYDLGIASSVDGKSWGRDRTTPVLGFADGRHSVLTPTILRALDGTPIREHGELRIWFSSTDFEDPKLPHTLHHSRSPDGIRWAPPSEPLLRDAYAPSVLRDGDGYRMWYTDVSGSPWVIRHAASPDGLAWSVTERPVLVIDQPWEKARLFYPCVVKADGVYLMWYGSYWTARPSTTALGSAVSRDGLTWWKDPHNPVLTPDTDRPWESHYTTSESVSRLADGTWRIWYASRKAPPHDNKYFALGTARWSGPAAVVTPAP